MRRALFVIACITVVGWGCARVRVEAPKEAIKVDISMRLDIYQHVEKDIDSIEDIVSGASTKPAAPAAAGQNSMINHLLGYAYAQEGLSPEVEQAAVRRRDRKSQLSQWQQQGVIGETQTGLVEIRLPARADAAAGELVRNENADRLMIYKAIAQKNGTTLGDVQALYAKRLQNDAPAGTPIEVAAGAWKTK